MKTLKLLAVIACVSALCAGCISVNKSCCAKHEGAADKPACGMKCCADGKTDCAHCPTCSAKK